MKIKRLKKKSQYLLLQRKAQRIVGVFLYLDIQVYSSSEIYYGITASSRYGNACERNRFKRLTRETVKHLSWWLPSGVSFIIYPRQKAKKIKQQALEQELKFLLTSFFTNQSLCFSTPNKSES